MSRTNIKYCPTCKPHEFQDKRYGKKMRVHNKMEGTTKEKNWRCTVCGNESA